MANTKSAEKRMRQNELRRQRNRANRSKMRTTIKRLRAAVDAGETDRAREMLPQAIRVIDKTAQKGVIHDNTASRYKSRLTKAVAGLSQ